MFIAFTGSNNAGAVEINPAFVESIVTYAGSTVVSMVSGAEWKVSEPIELVRWALANSIRNLKLFPKD